MKAMDLLRAAKHSLYVAKKRGRPKYIQGRGIVYRAQSRLRPYTFDLGRYKDPRGFYPMDFFLHRPAPAGWVSLGQEPLARHWLVWAGENALTPNRLASLSSAREHSKGLEVTLVTQKNVHDYVVEGHPLHPSYSHLSDVHKSDYLRAYLLHHHGGAYTDIKPISAPMSAALNRLGDAWLVGYPEIDSDLVANLHGPIGDDVRRQSHRIAGIGSMAALPRTPFTAEWLAEVERRIDYHSSLLNAHSATDPYGGPNYPLTWIGIGADVYEPLQLKYLERVSVDPIFSPKMADYR